MPCCDVSYTCLTRHVLREYTQWNCVPWGGYEQKKAVWFSGLPRVDSARWICLEIKILEHSIFHFFYWHISINKVHEVKWQLSTRKEFLESQEMGVWVLDGSFICSVTGSKLLNLWKPQSAHPFNRDNTSNPCGAWGRAEESTHFSVSDKYSKILNCYVLLFILVILKR